MTALSLKDAHAIGWPEDWPHENGQYLCRCRECGRSFLGHKRRHMCKPCSDTRTEIHGGPAMTMLEKMARAAYNKRFWFNSEIWREEDWPRARDSEMEIQRAALEALQEPSEGMYKAAMRYLRTDSETNFWAAWQAAIQHILEGK